MGSRVSIFSVFFLFAVLASASGGWVSSGGESFLFAKNPWFVKNTDVVNYCIQMDEASFSISRADVEKIIPQAFQYWKDEFARNSDLIGTKPYGYAKVATQTFSYSPTCGTDTPLVFKLGLKELSHTPADDEVGYLQDPKKYIGVTIRKNYDLTQLQGSGSIYISADLGADAYTNNGLLISNAWKNQTLFKYAVIHELGHFFGIPHVGSGLMSEVFMTMLLNKNMATDFSSFSLGFLNPQNNFEVCRDTSQFNPNFFQVSPTILCLKFENTQTGSLPQWKVSSRTDSASGTTYTEIGTVQVLSIDQSPYSLKTAVIIELPDTQKVFSPMEAVAGPFLVGATFADTSFIGSFRLKNTIKAVPLQLSLSADKISMVGTVNNQQMTILNYSPLGFLKAIIP